MQSFGDLQNQLRKTTAKNVTRRTEATAVRLQKEIRAYSLKECLEKGEKLLESKNLGYEILDKGSNGFLGFGKKLYKVLVFVKSEEEDTSSYLKKDSVKEEDRQTADGKIGFIVRASGIFLRVSSPEGKGKPVSLERVISLLEKKQYRGSNVERIKEVVQHANNEWVKIGNHRPDAEYDSRIKQLDISNDELSASVVISSPILCGRVLELEEIVEHLKYHELVFGIKEDNILKIIEEEKYDTPQVVALGIPPQNGNNAQIELHFDNKQEIDFIEDETGKVNFFTDFGLIQNVVAGQLLAVKKPYTSGTKGKTVTGKDIDPIDGTDVELVVGKNAKILDNGLEVIADNAGRAVYNNGVFEVEPVHKVNGNVGLKTGSIVFLGDVSITGNIEDGFNVKAAGNIYVGGNIGKCDIEADADVIVQRGIIGKESGLVKAGKNVISKFIENAHVKSSGKVVVTDGILNSTVDAKNVYCLGKRGTITGGHIRATEEIQAKVIGSQTYTETKVEAGIDPEAKEKFNHLERTKSEVEDELNKLGHNVLTLQKQEQAWQDKFPIEKRMNLTKMLESKERYIQQLDETNKDIEELKVYLHGLSTQGLISAFDTIYPRVEVTIKNITIKVNIKNAHVTFTLEKGAVKAVPYQLPKDKEIKKAMQESGKRKKGKHKKVS